MFEFFLCKIRTLLKTTFSWKRENSPTLKVIDKSKNEKAAVTIGDHNQTQQAKTIINNIITYNNSPTCTTTPHTPQPDLALRLVHPQSPALVIVNQSPTLAKNIKWVVALWNMDLPERNDPLPIPVSTFDWIRPHSEGGPQDLFSDPKIAPLLKQGDRLFGSASVCSPESARGRTYIVYIIWGKGGWFAEKENEKSGNILIPPNFLRATRENYFKALETVIPMQSRIPIK